MSETAKIIIANKTVEYPIIVGTEGEKAIDISKLRADTGCITLDNGLMNSGSCKSAVTFLDGEKGVLRYRGYSIDELAEKAIFREVAYLLIYGELPNKPQFKQFCDRVHKYSTLPEGVYKILDQYPLDAHPMAVASSVLAGLSAFYPEYLQSDLNPQQKDEVIAQIFAQFKLIISYFYRRTKGNTTRVPTQQDQTYAGDFINMMFHKPGFTIDPEISRALDILLILHADHEQNCSTSTVRVVGSSKANVFAAVSAGIDALWGQLHGGANQAVLEMLEEVRQDGGDVTKAIAKAKDKNSGFRLMGFGHRVYKNFDPRAKIIKVACDTVLGRLGVKDPLLDIAKGMEAAALKDPYFKERSLYPNVDFYSGIIYRALGIPTEMFTAMFALGRIPGWLAQWKEMTEDPMTKIVRPRQIYTGANQRPFIPMEKR